MTANPVEVVTDEGDLANVKERLVSRPVAEATSRAVRRPGRAKDLRNLTRALEALNGHLGVLERLVAVLETESERIGDESERHG